METIILPKILWNYMLNSLSLYLSHKYGTEFQYENEIWINISSNNRSFIELDNLKQSFFTRKKDLIGLDFNSDAPIIASGNYWIDKIQKAKEDFDSSNIYVFDAKYRILLFYIGEHHSLFIENDSILVKPTDNGLES